MSTFEEMLRRPDWFADANCRGLDPELFFPGRGQDVKQAKEVCRRCDVQVECLTYALNNGEKFGVFGGKSEKERRQIRSNVAKVRPIKHGTLAGAAAHRRRGELPCALCRQAASRYTAGAKAARQAEGGAA